MSWDTIKLGDYIETLTDYHANGAYKKLKANVELKYKSDYALMIRTLNFEQNNFNSNLIWVNETEYNFLSKSKVYPDDIIMNKIANAGSVYIMPNLNRPVSLAMNLFLIRFKELDQKFMYYLMKTNELYIKSFANGVATQSITKDAVRNLEFEIPSKTTQKRIADILSAYDDLIENNLKRINLLEQSAQNIYKEWFVNLRFPGYENTSINEETGLPEGWQEVLAKKYFDFKRGIEVGSKNYITEESENTIPFLRVGSLGSRDKDVFTNISLVKDRILNFNDLCISMDGTIGLVGYGLIGAYSTGLRKIVPKFNKYGNGFIYSLLKSDDIQDAIRAYAKGSTILHASSSIEHLKFNDAPDEISNQFNELVEPIYMKLLNLNKQIEKLKVARDILSPRLMNRTIEV